MAANLRPQVTVAMPVRDGLPALRLAIEDVRNQSVPSLEIIVIDDASSDGSADYVEGLDDPRITVIRNPKQLGVAGSLNVAISMATTPYLARMDADDRSDLRRLEVLLGHLQQAPRTGGVASFAQIKDDEGATLGMFEGPTSPLELQARLLGWCCLLHGTALFRTAALRDIGGYRSEFEPAEDYDMWLRLSELWSVRQIPDVLYTYVRHDDAQSVRRGEAQRVAVERSRAAALRRRAGGTDEAGSSLDRHLQYKRIGRSRAALHQLIWARNRFVNHERATARRLLFALTNIAVTRRADPSSPQW